MGGAEKSTLKLAKEINKQDLFKIYFLSLKKSDNDYQEKGVEVLYLRKSVNTIYQFLDYFSVYKIIREINPDIIHTTMLFSDWIVGFYKLINSNKKVISSIHTYQKKRQHTITFKHKIHFWIQGFLYKSFDRIVCVSNDLKEYMSTIFCLVAKRINVIPNGLAEPSKYPSFDQQSKFSGKLLYIGGLRAIKNVEMLIELLPYLPKVYTLTIIGDGEERKNLERRTKILGLENRIEFLGFIKDPYLMMKSFNILVIPSFFETFSISALEGLLIGIPTISTNKGGVKELYDNDISDLLFDSTDMNDLRRKILFIEKNYKEIVLRLSQKKNKYLKYSISNVASQYTRIYNELLST